MAIARFKTRHGWVEFKARKTAATAKPKTRRRSVWPKGKIPPHLKKFLFKKSRRSRR